MLNPDAHQANLIQSPGRGQVHTVEMTTGNLIIPRYRLLHALRRTTIVRAGPGSSKYARHAYSAREQPFRPDGTGAKSVSHGDTSLQSAKPALNKDRGPASKEETQTDFGAMNVLGNTPTPTSSIDACLSDGFHFGNGIKIEGGAGCMILAGEVFTWRPWRAASEGHRGQTSLLNKKGQWHVEPEAWSLLEVLQPKPGKSTFLHALGGHFYELVH